MLHRTSIPDVEYFDEGHSFGMCVEMVKNRIRLYDKPGGRVPKDLASFFIDTEAMVENAPNKGKRLLTGEELGNLIGRLSTLADHGPEALRNATKNCVCIGGDIYLLKIKQQAHNTRYYFSTVIDGVVYILHAYQKKTQAEDPKERRIAHERLNDLLERREPNGGGTDG